MKKVFQETEIPAIAKEILVVVKERQNKSGATLVALEGDLGAGKTTLVQAIARELGIIENIISPTYVIIKKYSLITNHPPERLTSFSRAGLSLFTNLIHIDAYRMEDPNELVRLGWQELISDPKNLIFLEWPERVAKILPENVITISLNHEEKQRSIDIKHS